jgi:hypothetical protein
MTRQPVRAVYAHGLQNNCLSGILNGHRIRSPRSLWSMARLAVGDRDHRLRFSARAATGGCAAVLNDLAISDDPIAAMARRTSVPASYCS